jgi:hypothetical protein
MIHYTVPFGDQSPLFLKVIKWLQDSENSLSETTYRTQAMGSYRFYAGNQDTPEVLSKLEEQRRPATVYNEIKPKVDMLVGLAAQAKHDVMLTPVGTTDEPLVQILNGTLIHYRRNLKITRKELECFEHTVKSGRSLLYFYIDKQNPYKPAIKARRIPGYMFFVDPNSVEYDLSDARYVFVEKWLTEEEITRFWPKYDISYAQVGARYADLPEFWNYARDLYRIVEVWYRVYEEVMWFQNPLTRNFENLPSGEFKKFQKAFAEGVDTGKGIVKQEVQGTKSFASKIKYGILSNHDFMEEGYSPFQNLNMMDLYPFVLYGAYKNEDANTWFSVIEMMKDPQRSLNTMRRQLSHLLQTLPKGILAHEAGSILNIEEYEERSSEPNFHLEVAPGGTGKYQFIQQPQISPIYQQLDQVMSQSIKDVGGIQNELMGVQTTSREPGVSIKARQETNLAVLYLLFDNLRESRLNGTKILLGLIQQYCTEPEMIRIEGEEGAQMVQINSQLNPQVQGFNDVTALQYDVATTEIAETQTSRMATAQILTEYSQNNPGVIPPDLILEYSDVPYTVKQKVRDNFKQQQEQQQQQAERDFQLRSKELEIKMIVAQAQLAAAQHKTVQGQQELQLMEREVNVKAAKVASDHQLRGKEIEANKKAQLAKPKPKLKAVK